MTALNANPWPPPVGREASRRDALDRWSNALSHGDDAEVERIVRQSHDATLAGAAPERIGALPLDPFAPPAPPTSPATHYGVHA